MVPAGAEDQPIVFDKPEVLVLDLTSGGIHVLVVHSHALLGGLEGPVVKHLLQVHYGIIGVVVAQDFAIGSRHEHVLLSVNAVGVVVIGQGRLQPIGVVAGDGLVHDELGVLVG